MNRVRDLLYLLLGYLSGCVLYAEVFSRVFHKEIASAAKDKNPGAANAFVHGGFWCGVLTLAGDMLKGMVPVALYMHYLPEALLTPLAPLVLCAPVAGHVFPATRSFKGGKGIATTFGCLLGLLPFWTPVLVLACNRGRRPVPRLVPVVSARGRRRARQGRSVPRVPDPRLDGRR